MAKRLFSQESICKALQFYQSQTKQYPPSEFMRPKYEAYDLMTDIVTVSFPTRSWYGCSGGIVCSGIISAMLDAAAGALAYCIAGKYASAISMQVQFLHPVPSEDLLIVRSKFVRHVHPFIFISLEASVQSFPDRLSATAEGIFYAGSGTEST